MANDDFKISDNQFKVLISSSLPSTWDMFTKAYIGCRRDIPKTNPKKLMSSQQFIGVIKEKAVHRNAHKAETTHQAISTMPTSKTKYCSICKHNNHNTKECRNRGKKTCSICKKPGHEEKDCWFCKGKRKREGQQSRGGNKKQKTASTSKEMNEGEAMQVEEEVTFMMEEDHDIPMDSSDEGQYFNLNNHHVNNADGNDEPLIYYDWLADTATTSHITNQREAFVTYKLLTGKTVV
jgi:hypothetical protein